MKPHEATYLSLPPEARKTLESLSVEHHRVMIDIMRTLSELVPEGGTFRWSTPFGFADFTIEHMSNSPVCCDFIATHK